MSTCNLDHSHEDVKKKYESQAAFLPAEINSLFKGYLEKKHTQLELNEVFHLLKKYDISPVEVRGIKNEQLLQILEKY
ncbi:MULTISPECIES: group-specific protein [unclassified Bacillus (in: firmicutes)]|uniref:group-specific protein n=1 Tax=unclassified Bacillus (in: firmicutes) TaxID=185979 RepID=UPI0008E14B1A|nr:MULTISPECIES: group-specific protein [unclassified Bacillus (in: firmicutes)]SFA88169.1 hypothetical protein SAMN02799634_102297 [Bacillus sp. UNCCL13]SFQ84526.1 hypothetical protein SAMN04488577_2415 [Bacillus sp. cl95]